MTVRLWLSYQRQRNVQDTNTTVIWEVCIQLFSKSLQQNKTVPKNRSAGTAAY